MRTVAPFFISVFTRYGYKKNIFMEEHQRQFVMGAQEINFTFHRNWENIGKIVMRKILFCEIWSF